MQVLGWGEKLNYKKHVFFKICFIFLKMVGVGCFLKYIILPQDCCTSTPVLAGVNVFSVLIYLLYKENVLWLLHGDSLFFAMIFFDVRRAVLL